MRVTRSLNITHITLILSLPIILALINPNWMFNNEIQSDDYFYLGHILDIQGYDEWYPATVTYFGERISWTIPSAIIHNLLPAIIANFTTHLLVYWIGIFVIYGIIQRLINDRVALFIALLLGNYPPFMRAVGWDYVDGATIAYLSLCLFFVVQSGLSAHKNRYLALAGMCAMLTVTTQLFTITLMPAILVFYFINRKPATIRVFVDDAKWVIGGIFTMAGVLGVCYWYLTGNWFYFKNSLNFSQDFSGDKDPRIYMERLVNMPSFWNILPFIIIFSALVALVRHHNKRQDSHYLLLRNTSLLFVACIMPFIVLLHYGYNFFVYTFYVSLLIPAIFILFASLIAPRFLHYTEKQYRFVIILAFIIPILPFFLFSASPHPTMPIFIVSISFLISLSVGLRVILPIWVITHHAIIILLFSVLGYVVGTSHYHSWMEYGIPLTYAYDRYKSQRIYEVTVGVAEAINRHFPEDKSRDVFLIWVLNEKENLDPNNGIFSELETIYYTWASSRVLSNIDSGVPDTKNLVVLTTQYTPEEMTSIVLAKLSENNVSVTTIESVTIEHGWGKIYAIFVEIAP